MPAQGQTCWPTCRKKTQVSHDSSYDSKLSWFTEGAVCLRTNQVQTKTRLGHGCSCQQHDSKYVPLEQRRRNQDGTYCTSNECTSGKRILDTLGSCAAHACATSKNLVVSCHVLRLPAALEVRASDLHGEGIQLTTGCGRHRNDQGCAVAARQGCSAWRCISIKHRSNLCSWSSCLI